LAIGVFTLFYGFVTHLILRLCALLPSSSSSFLFSCLLCGQWGCVLSFYAGDGVPGDALHAAHGLLGYYAESLHELVESPVNLAGAALLGGGGLLCFCFRGGGGGGLLGGSGVPFASRRHAAEHRAKTRAMATRVRRLLGEVVGAAGDCWDSGLLHTKVCSLERAVGASRWSEPLERAVRESRWREPLERAVGASR
jgi:hypothetical protein